MCASADGYIHVYKLLSLEKHVGTAWYKSHLTLGVKHQMSSDFCTTLCIEDIKSSGMLPCVYWYIEEFSVIWQKTFDCINREILLAKLHFCGI